MPSLKLSPESAAKLIAQGIENNLEELILAELKPQADEILKNVARTIARNVSAHMTGYEDFMHGGVVMHLHFRDNTKEIFKDGKFQKSE